MDKTKQKIIEMINKPIDPHMLAVIEDSIARSMRLGWTHEQIQRNPSQAMIAAFLSKPAQSSTD
jgi:hypothetical protein